MQIFGGWKVEREGEGGNTNFLFYLHMSKKSCIFAAALDALQTKTEREKS